MAGAQFFSIHDPIFHALMGYAVWMLLLLGGIATLRSFLTLSGARRANSFKPAGDDVSPLSGRLCRAHANCYENLPVFLSVVVGAALTGQAALLNGLAYWFLGLRIAQSTVHIASIRNRWVIVRFVLLLGQVCILSYWIVRLLLPS
jgi:uncharacterized MAPEG superfamily protein